MRRAANSQCAPSLGYVRRPRAAASTIERHVTRTAAAFGEEKVMSQKFDHSGWLGTDAGVLRLQIYRFKFGSFEVTQILDDFRVARAHIRPLANNQPKMCTTS